MEEPGHLSHAEDNLLAFLFDVTEAQMLVHAPAEDKH